jgi:hypothetical protein
MFGGVKLAPSCNASEQGEAWNEASYRGLGFSNPAVLNRTAQEILSVQARKDLVLHLNLTNTKQPYLGTQNNITTRGARTQLRVTFGSQLAVRQPSIWRQELKKIRR